MMPEINDRTPIWLDCDTGHDDAFAILLAAYNPDVRLLGISTVFGNAPLSNTTHNTLAILKAIGLENKVSVYPGASKPFCREAYHSPEIHGDSGLDGTTCLPVPSSVASTRDDDRPAIEAMYQALISTPKGTAWLVPTGALTNAALLFAIHPDLIDHIAGISLMGGAVGGKFTEAPMGKVAGEGERFGNTTPWAEFNIYIDPESAKSILGNERLAKKTTLITLDLTHAFLATREIQRKILYGWEEEKKNEDEEEPSMVRKLFVEILTFFAKTYAEVFNITAGPPLHDPLAVAAAFVPRLFDDRGGERFDVDVVTEETADRESSSQLGRTKVRLLPTGSEGVRIPRGLVDEERLWRLIESCLKVVDDVVDSR